jgi:predicted membrane protein
MANKTIINFILTALMVSYGAVGYFLLKEKLQKDSEKKIIFFKKQYKFKDAKDWNNENLTREQHQFYQYLQYAKPE